MCAMVFIVSVQWSSHRPIYLFGLARCYQRDWSQRASYSPGENATGGRPPVPGRQGGVFKIMYASFERKSHIKQICLIYLRCWKRTVVIQNL